MKLAFVAVGLFVLSSVAFSAEEPAENKLHGIWEVQESVVNGKEDGGEAGAFWILRKNGTYKIVKRGRKPEGKWSVTNDKRLELKVGDKVIMSGEWAVTKETLTITDKVAVFTFAKRSLKTEPTEPKRK